MQGFELAASAGAGGAGCHGAVAEISGPVGTALAVSAGQEARFMDMRPKKRPLHRKARQPLAWHGAGLRGSSKGEGAGAAFRGQGQGWGPFSPFCTQ